jgi:integrase
MAKLGAYPTMGVGEARKLFASDYAPLIARGETPTGPRARRQRTGVTVKDLFKAYVVKARGAASSETVENILLTGVDPAAKAIGETMRAADVNTSNIIPHLANIYSRGSPVMARSARAYIGAAFAFALASGNSYMSRGGSAEWGVKSNPVLAIPGDPSAIKPGNRHLTPAEFRQFWFWLMKQDVRSGSAPTLRLIMAIGQRVSEILKLSTSMYDVSAKMLDWGKTKNGQPHNIPLSPQAVTIMGILVPNKHGLYFPGCADDSVPLTLEAPNSLVARYLKAHPAVPHFTPRMLRRTWKTLAGAAGLSKEIRDRLQNHARSDVSSRHYDRWEMHPERRAAVQAWSAYLDRILNGDVDTEVVQLAGQGASAGGL